MLVDFSAKERGYLSCTPGAGQKGKRKEKKRKEEKKRKCTPSDSVDVSRKFQSSPSDPALDLKRLESL
jgi:hypothetical protein